MKYFQHTTQSMPFSIRWGPFETGSQTTDPVSALRFVTCCTDHASTSSRSAICTFFIHFLVWRVIISSLIAIGICRLFPNNMVVVSEQGSHVGQPGLGCCPQSMSQINFTCCVSCRGAECQYHQKLNNTLGLYPVGNSLSKCKQLSPNPIPAAVVN